MKSCADWKPIIAFNRPTTSSTVIIGTAVDFVSEVLNIKDDDIEDTHIFGTRLNSDYILGIAKMEGELRSS